MYAHVQGTHAQCPCGVCICVYVMPKHLHVLNSMCVFSLTLLKLLKLMAASRVTNWAQTSCNSFAQMWDMSQNSVRPTKDQHIKGRKCKCRPGLVVCTRINTSVREPTAETPLVNFGWGSRHSSPPGACKDRPPTSAHQSPLSRCS